MSRSLTVCLSLPLSLAPARAHTHTHTLSLSLSLCVRVCACLRVRERACVRAYPLLPLFGVLGFENELLHTQTTKSFQLSASLTSCLECMLPCMYAYAYRCLTRTPYVCVCLTFVPYVYALHVCLISMPAMCATRARLSYLPWYRPSSPISGSTAT